MAVRVAPDLGAGRAVMGLAVRGVYELARDDAVRGLGVQRVGFGHRARHALCARREDDLGPVGADELLPFDAHAVRHDDDGLVAEGRRHCRETDAGVAARALDDRAAGLQLARRLRRADDLQRDAVLGAAGGVVSFKLRKQARTGTVRFFKGVQLNQRRFTDERRDVRIDVFHKIDLSDII